MFWKTLSYASIKLVYMITSEHLRTHAKQHYSRFDAFSISCDSSTYGQTNPLVKSGDGERARFQHIFVQKIKNFTSRSQGEHQTLSKENP